MTKFDKIRNYYIESARKLCEELNYKELSGDVELSDASKI